MACRTTPGTYGAPPARRLQEAEPRRQRSQPASTPPGEGDSEEGGQEGSGGARARSRGVSRHLMVGSGPPRARAVCFTAPLPS
jgi:hypothetical protein